MAQNQLHPGARWQFRISGYFLFGILGIFFGVWIIAPITELLLGLVGISASSTSAIVVLSVLGYIIFVIAASEIYARMSYNRWFYEFTPTNLRVERGIIWKKYSNIPYERVQNVDIQRGIIARVFGFSAIMIQTAGYSAYSQYGMQSEGNLPAISVEAGEKIRDFLMQKISKQSKGGL